MSLVSRGLELRSISKDTRSVDFVASTDAIDSYGDIVEQVWRLDRFKSNPVILFGHNSRDLPIGKATRVEVADVNGRKQLECTIQIASAAANPLAENVWKSIEEGTLRAVSVGFVPNDYRWEKRDGREVFVLSDNELHEISVVPIPANPEALAKMKSKARGVVDGHPKEKDTMKTIEEYAAALAKSNAELDISQKTLADAQREATSTKAALAAAEGTIRALTEDRDAQKARADKAEKASVEAEVAQLVGVKITPAEKDDFVALAQTNRPMFERMVAARPEMKLLGGPVVTDSKTAPKPVIDAPTNANGGELAAKIFSS